MIDLERLRPYPPERYPIVSDAKVRETIGVKIKIILESINKPLRSISMTQPQLLFEIKGGTEGSILLDNKLKVVGEVEYERLQKLGFEIMSAYGLDPTVSFLDKGQPPSRRADGTGIEIRLFPSQFFHDLLFKRWYTYMADTKEPVYIAWQALDDGQDIGLDFVGALRSLFRR